MKQISNLEEFISYCESTKPEEWAVDVVRTKDGCNCLFGHLVKWYYGDEYNGSVMDIWDCFEEIWATTYMVYPVNDGKNPKYQQGTARERCIAYLKDLSSGSAKTTQQLMEEDYARI
jgi:hypothetical protein